MPFPVKNQEYFRYTIGIILGIPLLFLLIICPILEFINIQFSQYIHGPTKAKWVKFIVEGFYFACTIWIPCHALVACLYHCCKPKFLIDVFKNNACYVFVWWIVAASIYTIYMVVFDQEEIHNIPFNCPTSYDYQSQFIQAACKIRFINMICMWLYVLFGILWYAAGIFDYLPRKEDMKWWNKWFGDEKDPKGEFIINQSDVTEWVQSTRRETFVR
ncbi:hypothetical protein F8M41_025818 [Gigaspora margarita]|uniref:Uncharacterized protein n=1 Tax=Gigaspora margarita TaxID=4874 RepID=A0A8H4A9J8_GIGMA|nr:hypothetical protein F8M41_025818 [Gigaspora margarita]